MLGLEGVGWVTPGLDIPLLRLDPRFVGRSTTPVGLGVFVRYDPNPILTVELGTRSGSLRYRSDDGAPSRQVLLDYFVPSAGLLLWPFRADVARFGLDMGVGGIYSIARYDLAQGRSRQSWGAFAVRAGFDVEVGGPRLSLLLSLQAHGVITPVDTAVSEGSLFEGTTKSERRAPVTPLASWVSGTLGLGYRF